MYMIIVCSLFLASVCPALCDTSVNGSELTLVTGPLSNVRRISGINLYIMATAVIQ